MVLSAGWLSNLSGKMSPDISDKIFEIKDQAGFLEKALDVFRYQAENNPVYREFISKPGIMNKMVNSVTTIPFLPVEFFRNFKIITGNLPHEIVFESSGTSGNLTSRHYVTDLEIYRKSFRESFRIFYGNPADYVIAALLPSYLEKQNSSLIYMMNELISLTGNPLSGFFNSNFIELIATINKARKEKQKILLMGVSFALLDLAEQFSPDLSDVVVIETGGMKGRRKELTRPELHSILMRKLNVRAIHSEYGMAELLSQAYSNGEGIFHCPPWMKILIRDPQDPLSVTYEPGITGGISIIDLANINSCSFIATADLGRLHEDGGFEVLGRFDNSDIRGCNLLLG
jgi:phenylacetate-coenzyme A ligase PaaK-like adenylate-forming protein